MQAIAPMLAKTSRLPEEDSLYAFEIKWDGIRALVYFDGKIIKILSRNNKDITSQYPEISQLAPFLPQRPLILDGEIVAFSAGGRPSFSQLQHRMGLVSEKKIRLMMQQIPVTLVIFDILLQNEELLIDLPYIERRLLLEKLQLNGRYWQTPAYSVGSGLELLTASRNLGLEGVIAKKLDHPYEPGKRSGAWVKIKNQKRQELVIAGWVPGQGARSGKIGALLVGYYDTHKNLHYAGAVGTGFTAATLNKLATSLLPLQQKENPFFEQPPQKDINFVQPKLIGEFEFTEWTPNHTLRHPSFKGLRTDKQPYEVIREETNLQEV